MEERQGAVVPSGENAFACAATIVLLALNGLVARMELTSGQNAGHSAVNLLGISAVVWFALFAVWRIAADERARAPWPSGRALVPYVCFAACALVPLPWVSAAALVPAGLFFILGQPRDCAAWRIGFVALALSGPIFFGPLVKSYFGPELSSIETYVVGTLSNVPIEGNVIAAVDGRSHLVVTAGCTALANISLAMLLTVTLGQLFAVRRSGLLLCWALAACLAVVLVNVARLTALAYNPGDFANLHEGFGRAMFNMAAFLAMCIVAMAGTVHATRTRA